jgi:Cu(I)/Ag(I) efflux system membrane fusion protein
LSGLGGHVAHGGSAPPSAGQKQPDISKQPDTSVNEHTGHGATARNKPAVVGHHVQGTLNTINADGTVNITHGPVDALDWPGMTMDFVLANSALVVGIGPGTVISFEIVERKPGEWVITSLQAKQTLPSGYPRAEH